jgi:hypothetical protein
MQENKFKFDKTISLGQVIVFIGFLCTAMAQWNLMDKRVVVLEEFKISQRERDVAQDSISKDKYQEVKEALNELRRSVEKVADKIGAK